MEQRCGFAACAANIGPHANIKAYKYFLIVPNITHRNLRGLLDRSVRPSSLWLACAVALD